MQYLCLAMQEETEKIPFIHNYCDRWCARCQFTSRCAVFEMEQEAGEGEDGPDNDAFWQKLTAVFQEANSMLSEKARELGIDISAIDYDEIESKQKMQDEQVSGQALTKLAKKYIDDSRRLLESPEDWLFFSALDDETREEMLSIIHWYQLFIATKIHRGFHGVIGHDGREDTAELNDPQSDSNGSVKIALIAIERSIMAWSALLSEESGPEIKPLINLLEAIRRQCNERFPAAKDFIRPGFDEMEMVM